MTVRKVEEPKRVRIKYKKNGVFTEVTPGDIGAQPAGDYIVYEAGKSLVDDDEIAKLELYNGPEIYTGTTQPTEENIKIWIDTTAPKEIKYGRLYSWDATTDVRGIAPAGWHIPSDMEWRTLFDLLSPSAGNKLKALTYWDTLFTIPTNESNFTAYGSGYFNVNGNPTSSGEGFSAQFWSSDKSDVGVLFSDADPFIQTNKGYGFGLAIRLIKDNSTNEGDVIIDGDTYNSVTIGTQVWLKQNLAVKHYQNGDLIGSDFGGNIGAVTSYDNDETNVYY